MSRKGRLITVAVLTIVIVVTVAIVAGILFLRSSQKAVGVTAASRYLNEISTDLANFCPLGSSL